MKFEEIVSELKKGNFAQIYLLTGEEPWYADYITDYIAEHAIKKEEKDFNQTILYGNDVNATDIVHAARRYPMMAPKQVIIVREAQNIKDWEALEHYLNAPAPTTILVLNHRDKFDKRRKVWKLMTNKEFVTLETRKLKEYETGPWINKYLKSIGLDIDPKANVMLVEHLGSNLSNIVKALDKLKVAVGKDVNTITPKHIEDYIGISKDYNAFELQDAIVKGDVLKANQIIRIFGQNPNVYSIQLVIGALFGFFRKLMIYLATQDKSQQNMASKLGVPPFVVKNYQAAARRFNWTKCRQVVSLLREYDMRSKGFNNNSATHGDLLQELVFKIMH
ncbi:MAG: DNA polymerase III subunit delta [Marinilabilia sp.]